jgi:hypothetical protein
MCLVDLGAILQLRPLCLGIAPVRQTASLKRSHINPWKVILPFGLLKINNRSFWAIKVE